YRITLPAAGTLQLRLSSAAFTGRLAIRDLKGNLIVADEDVQDLGVVQILSDLPAADYLISAASVFGSGGYQLTSTLHSHALSDCGFAQPLNIDGGFIQKLGVNPCRGANGQPLDLYEFLLPSDSVVAAIMTSGQVDGFLSLT